MRAASSSSVRRDELKAACKGRTTKGSPATKLAQAKRVGFRVWITFEQMTDAKHVNEFFGIGLTFATTHLIRKVEVV